ncbi:MAG: response regulator transcription factor [Chloroflexi bacterium]|nr:response regulator transcription factor [Chloroflexota bacterium]MBI3763127.1 response regulator transcription factor [Chloroflexota bacterium]
MAAIRLLIADDSAEMRRDLRMILALEQDIQIVALARDGAEAIELASRIQPDVAVMDLDMPRVNGLAGIRGIREKSPGTVCLVLSAEGERGFVQQAMKSGAREYFVKPVQPDELIAAIRRVGAEAAAQKQTLTTQREAEAKKDRYLVKLAEVYAKERRTDDEALKAYEELAARPNCETSWLVTLATAYLIRHEWGKLKTLAERLEKLQSKG